MTTRVDVQLNPNTINQFVQFDQNLHWAYFRKLRMHFFSKTLIRLRVSKGTFSDVAAQKSWLYEKRAFLCRLFTIDP